MTKYLVEIPDEIRVALEQRASAAGSDVSQLIQTAVVSFIHDSVPTSTVGRLPDLPMEAPEIVAPCDLPKSGPRPIPIQHTSKRGPASESQAQSPMSQRVRLVGRLTGVRVDGKAFAVVLDDGHHVSVQWIGGDMAVVTALTDERVLVLGTAIYSPTGNLLRIDADDVTRSSDESNFFSSVPRPTSTDFEVDEVRREQEHKRGLSAIIGLWPGDESDEEVAAALKELS